MMEESPANDSQASPNTPQARPLPLVSGFQGKHRMAAAISRFNQEIQFLEEELEELDTSDTASKACKDVILSIENKPDPLLPITKGPANVAWDRWFQRSRSSRSHKWWTHKRPDSY